MVEKVWSYVYVCKSASDCNIIRLWVSGGYDKMRPCKMVIYLGHWDSDTVHVYVWYQGLLCSTILSYYNMKTDQECKFFLHQSERWSGYRGDASLLLRAHASVHSSDYQDVLWLHLPVQQGCGGDLSWNTKTWNKKFKNIKKTTRTCEWRPDMS